MEQIFLKWTVTNWITVVLMAALGMGFVGLVSSGLRAFGGQSSADLS